MKVFELQADEIETLIEVVSKLKEVEKLKFKTESISVFKSPLEAKELNNKYLFKHNIVLTHLLKEPTSLEEQFLN